MDDALRITYEIRRDAPPAMPESEYVTRVADLWQQLLASDPPEEDVQAFLETHPCLVPGADAAVGRFSSGHAPFPHALITQPELRGLETKRPDFVWLSQDSLFLSPVFVEIEAPRKRWVTEKGHAHHHLTQALHQLADWRRWLDRPVNRQLFFEFYELPRRVASKEWQPLFLLIHGRRSENATAVNRIRAEFTTPTQRVIPYEHLAPDPNFTQYLCARRAAAGLTAVSVPACIELSPQSAEDWRHVAGKEDAASNSPWLSDERRAFLRERFSYWDTWGADPRGLRNLADRE